MEKINEDVKIKIMSYLDYESIEELSYTNKKNKNLYNKIKEKKYLTLISTKYPYIQKNYIQYNYNNYYIYSSLYVQVVEYNENIVCYKYVTYGKYNLIPFSRINVYIPIMEGKKSIMYYLVPEIIKPSYNGNIVSSKEEFCKKYEIYNNNFYRNIEKRKISYYIILLYLFIQLQISYIFFNIPLFILFYIFYFFVYIYKYIIVPTVIILSGLFLILLLLAFFQISYFQEYYLSEHYP